VNDAYRRPLSYEAVEDMLHWPSQRNMGIVFSIRNHLKHFQLGQLKSALTKLIELKLSKVPSPSPSF
jgi:hypothetical protein